MKKIVIGLIAISALLVSGCTKEVNLDLEKAKKEISNLKQTEAFYPEAYNTILEKKLMGEIIEIYDYELKDKLGIETDSFEYAHTAYNEKTKEFYIIIKPSDITKAKAEMKKYTDKLTGNFMHVEHNGHLIYINSSKNEAVLNELKNAKLPLLGTMMNVELDQIENILKLKKEQVSEFLMQTPMMMTQSSTYIVIKPADGQEKEVTAAINKYMEELEKQWSTYLPNQHEIVKNRTFKKIGDYLVMVATENNKIIIETIEKSIK